ncbi:MAG: gamma-glutamyl-gamma-aminobutyrate hydrolase family protein [Mariprofundales bacterium]
MSKKTLAIIQFLECEPAALLQQYAELRGWECSVFLVQKDGVPENIKQFSGLLVMGGSMSANDIHLPYIRDTLLLLQDAITCDMPVLGVCLGAQLLAKAAGAKVYAGNQELGWLPIIPSANVRKDVLFSNLVAGGLAVFHWHGETFSLPDEACLLASSAVVAHQAFRLGRRQYGLQFHVEVDAHIINQWILVGDAERNALGQRGINYIKNDTPQYIKDVHRFARQMMDSWLALCS